MKKIISLAAISLALLLPCAVFASDGTSDEGSAGEGG